MYSFINLLAGEKIKKRILFSSLAGIIILLLLSLGGCSLLKTDISQTPTENNTSDTSNNLPQDALPPDSQKNYTDITITAIGDILIHNTLYYGAYNPSTGEYDFNPQFKYVKAYLEDADITIANLETTLAGPEKGYSSYPQFSTPDSIIDALKLCGIDILSAANNHRMDTGTHGFFRTIQVVRDRGLDIIGVKAEETEKTYVIKDIKGIKVAFLNFGYAYPLENGSISVNGLILPAKLSNLMDYFDPRDLEVSTAIVQNKISAAKKDGAELIVVCMHWGDEYHRLPNDFQERLASRLANMGASVIFGGHPHVLQPLVYLAPSEETIVPVFYSLGNFISDQRKETVDDIYTEQGMIAKVTFRMRKNKQPEPILTEAIPTWVNKKIINSRYIYEVIPAQEALRSQETFPLLNANDTDRIQFCVDTVDKLTLALR